MDTFHYSTTAQEILFGAGAFSRLKEQVELAGWERLVLVTSPSQRANGRAAAVKTSLGGRLAATFDGAVQHVQEEQVEQILSLARAHLAGGLIALGGGSPIGLAKAACHALSDSTLIAIPTTYAGSEMTPTFGVTRNHETPPRKVTTTSPAAVPRLVIYDPELTLDLPPQVTASTGINALAHCLEALYSVTRNPLSTAAAKEAAGEITRALPRCHAHPDDLAARTDMLRGAHLAGLALASVKMGLHHGLCHVLGGTLGIPHGIANAILLPHALRFNAETAAPQLGLAAQAMGIHDENGEPGVVVKELIRRVSGLIEQLGLPHRLRDAGVEKSSLPGLAQMAVENSSVQNNPRPVTSVDQMEHIFEEAW